MSLYIKLFNDFWHHRKTARLRSIIGDEALWIMPRLWSYAAESQPDGDFSDYTSEELAMLIGCVKHASSIRQALLQSGFMEENGKLHNWEDRNGYHAEYAERARYAANVRWKKSSDTHLVVTGNDMTRDKHCFKHASSMDKDADFNAFWVAYPRKDAKKVALKAWQKAIDKPALEIILAAVARQKATEQWRKDSGQYIPMPATWLNQGRWDDKPIEAPKPYRGPNI